MTTFLAEPHENCHFIERKLESSDVEIAISVVKLALPKLNLAFYELKSAF